MVYQLPSTFQGGMAGAIDSLKKGTLPQVKTSPVVKPTAVKQTFLPPKPLPVDPNKTPEAFKKRFIEKHGNGVADDGRKYSDIDASEIVVKVIRKYGDGNTSDGIPYRDFLPRGSEGDSLEYRLSTLESLYKMPKSQYAVQGGIRGQTAQEEAITTDVTKRQNESEIMKTIKAPGRGVESAGQNLAYGAIGLASDVVDNIDGKEPNSFSDRMRSTLEQEQYKTGLKNQSKGIIEGIRQGELSSVAQGLSQGGAYMVASAKIPLYLMSLLQGGNMSAEGEQQGKNTLTDKAIAYGTGAISSYIDRLSGKNVIDGLEKVGIKRIQSTKFVDKMNNYLKTLKPSDIEVGTEVIQQKIENIGRDIMGVNYQKGLEQYFEAGLMGKVLGKVGDKGRAEATVTNVTPPPVAPEPTKTPKYVSKNLEVIKGIRTGVKGYDIVNRAKSRGFDPESDVSTYGDISPEIDENGKVNTDNAQINLSSHIRPLQKQMDDFIDGEGQYTSAEDFKTALLEEIESESGDIVNYDRWKKTIIDAAATASAKFGDENGRIPIVEINKIKKKNGKKGNYFNPDDSLYKAIARGAAKIVEQNTLNVDAKALNNELARLYTTQDYLILLGKGTKTVKGGKLGGYTASLAGRIAGAIIGSVGGPITSAIGSVAGGEISSKIHSSNLKNLIKTGNTKLPQSKLFEDARKAQQNKKANMLLPPPSGKPTSADVVNVQTMTGYAPGALQKDMLARGTMPNDSLIQKSKLPNPKIQEGKLQGKPLEEIKSTPIIPKIAKKQETPKKQALPMSQKSAVKYGKVDDGKVLLDSLMPSDRPMGEKTLSDLKYTENKVRTEKKPATKLEVAIEKAKAISDSGGDGEVGNYHIDDVLNKIKNGRIKVYHGTNMENSSKIGGWADLKDGTYLSLTKGADREAAGVYGAKYYADIADKYGKEGIVREFEIPISKLAIDDVTGEIRFIGNT